MMKEDIGFFACPSRADRGHRRRPAAGWSIELRQTPAMQKGRCRQGRQDLVKMILAYSYRSWLPLLTCSELEPFEHIGDAVAVGVGAIECQIER